VTHEDYVRKFEASENLKWSLSDDVASEGEKPLGKPRAPEPSAAVASGGAATTSATASQP
jgi:hypothetical protein